MTSTPKTTLADIFPDVAGDLPISGGWAQTKEDACVIERERTSQIGYELIGEVNIQKIFVEKRIYLELIVLATPEAKCSGIRWGLVSHEIVRTDGRLFEHLTFEVTAFLSKDWEELKAEWEGPAGYGAEGFDIERHLKKRVDSKNIFLHEFWFDVTAWQDVSLYGFRFPLEVARFRRGSTTCFESQSPGLGYSIGYNDSLNSGIATIYVYDNGQMDIPTNLTDSAVVDQLDRCVAEISEADEQWNHRSQLLQTFSVGNANSGKGFIGALFRFDDSERKSTSAVLLTVLADRFVKLRITVPDGEQSLQTVATFVEKISRVLWPEETATSGTWNWNVIGNEGKNESQAICRTS